MNNVQFSINLRRLRKERAITQSSLANSVGISQKTINHLENDYRKPSYELLITLADFFGVSLDYLVGRSAVSEIK